MWEGSPACSSGGLKRLIDGERWRKGCWARFCGEGRAQRATWRHILAPKRIASWQSLFALDQRGLAGDAIPGAVFLDPCVGKAPASNVGFTSSAALFGVGAGDDGGVTIDVCDRRVVDNLRWMKVGRLDRGEEFGLVHDAAVIVNINQCAVK